MGDPAETVRELQQRVLSFLQVVGRDGGLLPGSLYTSRTRCGRTACKCMASDYRHESQCLSFRQAGKSRTRTVPDALLEDIRTRTDAYRRARHLRKIVAQTAAQLIRELDNAIARAALDGQRDMLVSLARERKGRK